MPKNTGEGSGLKSKHLPAVSNNGAKIGADQDGKANQLRTALLARKVLLPRPPQRQLISPDKHMGNGIEGGDFSSAMNSDLDSIFNTVQAKSVVAK